MTAYTDELSVDPTVTKSAVRTKQRIVSNAERSAALTRRLSVDEKAELNRHNRGVAKQLDRKFVVQLDKVLRVLAHNPYRTFIRLGNPIPRGHTVDYQVLQGNIDSVRSLGELVGAGARAANWHGHASVWGPR